MSDSNSAAAPPFRGRARRRARPSQARARAVRLAALAARKARQIERKAALAAKRVAALDAAAAAAGAPHDLAPDELARLDRAVAALAALLTEAGPG